MPLNQADLAFLTSAAAVPLLADVAKADLSNHNLLALITSLREKYPADHISAAITMTKLRQQAQGKFGADALQLLFTDDALQQASDPLIRHYRAQTLISEHTQESQPIKVLDVCCGIGTDSIAFARAGAQVHGVDSDPLRIEIARHNAAALNLDIQFSVMDATTGIPDGYDIIFFDPARRDEQGKRIYNVEAYLPPLSLITQWEAPQIIVKLSPGVDSEQLHPYGGRVEFISVHGDLKEAVLHTPTDKPHTFATRIEYDAVHHWYPKFSDNTITHPTVPLAEPMPDAWLCEPDPAILRASLVEDVADALNGRMLDDTIAYFCTDEQPTSTWVRAWRIRDWLPFNLKKLRARLREMNVGTLTVKKRGSPITPEDLIRKLKLKGNLSATVVLTRHKDQPIVIICDDILTD